MLVNRLVSLILALMRILYAPYQHLGILDPCDALGNAIQAYYVPEDIVATRDANNRIYVSSDGGGLYYVDNSDWSSHTLNQIADFVRGLVLSRLFFENIYTNLPDFTRDLFLDQDGDLWLFAINGAEINAYKKMYEAPTLYSGSPATYHLFGNKKSQHLF